MERGGRDVKEEEGEVHGEQREKNIRKMEECKGNLSEG